MKSWARKSLAAEKTSTQEALFQERLPVEEVDKEEKRSCTSGVKEGV
jgi:hypothetical protein